MEDEKGHICGIENCRSRRYHVETDGFKYCSHGHRAEVCFLPLMKVPLELKNKVGSRRCARRRASHRSQGDEEESAGEGESFSMYNFYSQSTHADVLIL